MLKSSDHISLFFLDVGHISAASRDSIQFHMVSYCSAIKCTLLEAFNAHLIIIALFCFDKFPFRLVVGDMLEKNIFSILDSDYVVNNISQPILADIGICLHAIVISTQPND